MQVMMRIVCAGLVVVWGCSSSDQGNGAPPTTTPPPADAATSDTPTTPMPDAGGCTSNSACTDQATMEAQRTGTLPDSAGGVVPAVCIRAEGRCAPLLSDDCRHVTGSYRDDDAIVLGTLLSTEGVQSATNLQRQQAASLAIEQINTVGGIPPATMGGRPRPLVMVSCDEVTNLMRAANHLVNDLKVPAIIGPNTSQDTLDVSNKLTIQSGTVLVTPTAVASSITDLMDNDLTWLMVPSDMQRGKLMKHQINAIEQDLHSGGKAMARLAIVYRNDALGIGTMKSLNDLTFNGKPLNDPVNAGAPGGNALVEGYDAAATEYGALVAKLAAFAPDIVVLAGTAEAITGIMTPLEQGFSDASSARPSYLLIDSVKTPQLITAASNASLRSRIRGTGIRPGPESQPVATAFELDYRGKYGVTPTASGVGPSYDATYAVTYAIAATRGQAVTGAAIAKGLRKLSGGSTNITVGSANLTVAFNKLTSGDSINAIGTFVPFEWDMRGAIEGGVIEVWCISAPTGTPSFQSSGLSYDVKRDMISGTYAGCSP